MLSTSYSENDSPKTLGFVNVFDSGCQNISRYCVAETSIRATMQDRIMIMQNQRQTQQQETHE